MNDHGSVLSVKQLQLLVEEQQERIRRLELRQSRPRLPRRLARRRSVFAIAALTAALSVTGGAFAAISARTPDAGGVIHGCYLKSSGALRVTGSTCAKGERSLNWNQQGSPGPKGDTGVQGPQGPKGDIGAQGPAGVSPKNFCPGCDMTGADLSNQNLRGAYYPVARLAGTMLTNVDLRSSDLTGAYIGPSSSAPTVGPDLTGAQFWNANLWGATLEKVTAHNASFIYANLYQAFLDGNFDNAQFQNANLTAAGAANAYFANAAFSHAYIGQMNLSGAILENANFVGAHGTPDHVSTAVFAGTICPDGSNSDNDAHTCTGHWLP
jgi:uncharacterized protein YjbI with pentapeptide repeats